MASYRHIIQMITSLLRKNTEKISFEQTFVHEFHLYVNVILDFIQNANAVD